MSRDDELAALVALLRRRGLDAPEIPELVESRGPEQAFATLSDAQAEQLTLIDDDPAPQLARAVDAIERWRAAGIQPLGIQDPAYPRLLRLVHDRPPLLFVSGRVTAADDRAVAIIGARQATDAGRAAAATLARELVAAGYTIASGLAAGIDAAAHRAALDAGGRTIAVIGSGHEHTYPPENARLQSELNAVLSPFWPETPPSGEGFRRRNAVMSGLTLGTVIVEASERSGTRVQARRALAQTRPVFLMRPVLARAWAAELARRPGVHVVATAAEVDAVLQRLHPLQPSPEQRG